MKPFAESCEQNREPILGVLREVFPEPARVLEVGSGTGQHAVYFAGALPHLTWQTSDLDASHDGIRQWLREAGLDNVLPPLSLDCGAGPWPDETYDGVFSANTVHIMHWPHVEGLFAGVGRVLRPGGRFALYGPFNYEGAYTSDSNARFDDWLHQRDPKSGIRDFEALDALAHVNGLALREDYAMPANNRTVVWERRA